MNTKLKRLSLSAMFVAIGLLLPFITMQIPEIGKLLCPMHIPVMLCGLICGAPCGLAVGFITPLLRSLLFAMPALYPSAAGMAFELAAYGFAIGLIYSLFTKKDTRAVYVSLISSMLIGRIVWGLARVVMLGLSGPETASFSLGYFFTTGFLEAIPGIILQLILIPAIMAAMKRAGLAEKTG